MPAAAASSPDSFYGFKAQGYRAQHTPAEIRVCLGQREWVGRARVVLGNIPPAWRGCLALQGQHLNPRGCVKTLVSQRVVEGKAKLNGLSGATGEGGTTSPATATQLRKETSVKAKPLKMEVKTQEERAWPRHTVPCLTFAFSRA